jgi:glycine cleavage system pyridoxal-binding protein P
MSLFKKTMFVFLLLGLMGVFFLSWYAAKHSMDEARTFQVNEQHTQHRLLIATQGSTFKDSVVSVVVDQLRTQPIYISVIDVSQLPKVNENDWSAIVILHTWQIFGPQEDAKEFIERIVNKDKLIVVSTSGSAEERMEGVDGMTSASLMLEIPSLADKIVQRVTDSLDLQ